MKLYNDYLKAQEEISRLRAALERFGDSTNWHKEKDKVSYTGYYVFGRNSMKEKQPWLLAQEALNG